MNKKYTDLSSVKDPNYLRLWRQKQDKKKRALYAKTYYETNKEQLSQKNKERHQRNPKAYRETRWRQNGIKNFSYNDYLRLLNEQQGVCRICGDLMGSPHVDHNHETGKVRGLLCRHCNSALGLFKDNLTTIAKALDYLTEFTHFPSRSNKSWRM
jgi:hypothetical protein